MIQFQENASTEQKMEGQKDNKMTNGRKSRPYFTGPSSSSQ